MELETIKKPIHEASFHGEDWYRCPKCNKSFEFYETKFESDKFKHISGNIYQHIEDNCNQLIDMT